jgi:hypothetical protein
MPKAFLALRQLYNIKYDAYLLPSEDIKIDPSSIVTAGPVWLSGEIARVSGFEELGKIFRSEGEHLGARLKQTTWILLEDQEASQKAPASVSPQCAAVQIKTIHAQHLEQVYRFEIDPSPGDCLMTVATNYVTELTARGYTATDHEKREAKNLTVLPVNGPLTGIVTPKGTTEVVLEAKSNQPLWKLLSILLGTLLLGIAGAVYLLLPSLLPCHPLPRHD